MLNWRYIYWAIRVAFQFVKNRVHWWLKQAVAGLLSRRSEFIPRTVHGRFVVDGVAVGRIVLEYLEFARSVFHTVIPFISHRRHAILATDSVVK